MISHFVFKDIPPLFYGISESYRSIINKANSLATIVEKNILRIGNAL
ncbi:hypothetical protein CKC_05575 [Candidatus Liberibacter solanacearum CLso-ZC1]|uniref:Uncharacterized protein n=1 Tax=Liberibacter solanacearum (strain CLso-ZC1) TaxID=658172 RepID=E4UE32_LIBSC|nr:hypothetical protein CKC_05575 [Candidatus Liberibacter solanacearum CLso-ZC1]